MRYSPAALVSADALTSVAVLAAVTKTFGIIAPLASVTLPTRSPLIACACSLAANGTTPAKNTINSVLNNICCLCIAGLLLEMTVLCCLTNPLDPVYRSEAEIFL